MAKASVSPPTSWAICVQAVCAFVGRSKNSRLNLWVAASPALCCLIPHAVIQVFSHPLVFQFALSGEFVF